jgi:hypothetical protein
VLFDYVMFVRLAATALCLLAGSACSFGGGSGSAETVTVTHRATGGGKSGSTETVTVTVTAASEKAVNLVVTDEIRQSLRRTATSGFTSRQAKQTKGPLPGSVYYGEYGGIKYALATFDFPITGTTDQPDLFVQLPGVSYWVAVTDVGGSPLSAATPIPCPLRKVWGFGCTEQ